ncbi:hypothetical protein ABPG77_005091 [Micractinium sp. CCAP 211/92]
MAASLLGNRFGLLDRRRQRAEDLAGLLAQRQATLHRFSVEVLDRLVAAGLEDEAGSAAAFREWYLAQLAASDALLRRLQGSSGTGLAPDDPASQLAATLERLGLTAAELALLASGTLEDRPSKGDKAQGPSVPIRPRRIHGARQRRDPVQKERALLERLVRHRSREDHHPAFQGPLEQEANVPRCAGGGDSKCAGESTAEGEDEGNGASQGGTAPQQCSKCDGGGGGCSTSDMLAAFDEGDCLESADCPDLPVASKEGSGGDSSGEQ